MTQSRWAEWTTVQSKGLSLAQFLAENEPGGAPIQGGMPVQTGNPTGTGAQTPGEKARQAGLQSDGHGGWIDPNSGQVVARTVQGELVWYDAGPGGGVISDGEGGEQLTQAAPSWVDPVTGQIKVAPAQPESPEEIAAVPDSVPSQAPAGYDAWVTQTTQKMYAADKALADADQEIAGLQAEVDEIYGTSPMMQELKAEFDDIIKQGESGSPEQQEQAAALRDVVNDNAEKYQDVLGKVEGQEELEAEALELIIDSAIRSVKGASEDPVQFPNDEVDDEDDEISEDDNPTKELDEFINFHDPEKSAALSDMFKQHDILDQHVRPHYDQRAQDNEGSNKRTIANMRDRLLGDDKLVDDLGDALPSDRDLMGKMLLNRGQAPKQIEQLKNKGIEVRSIEKLAEEDPELKPLLSKVLGDASKPTLANDWDEMEKIVSNLPMLDTIKDERDALVDVIQNAHPSKQDKVIDDAYNYVKAKLAYNNKLEKPALKKELDRAKNAQVKNKIISNAAGEEKKKLEAATDKLINSAKYDDKQEKREENFRRRGVVSQEESETLLDNIEEYNRILSDNLYDVIFTEDNLEEGLQDIANGTITEEELYDTIEQSKEFVKDLKKVLPKLQDNSKVSKLSDEELDDVYKKIDDIGGNVDGEDIKYRKELNDTADAVNAAWGVNVTYPTEYDEKSNNYIKYAMNKDTIDEFFEKHKEILDQAALKPTDFFDVGIGGNSFSDFDSDASHNYTYEGRFGSDNEITDIGGFGVQMFEDLSAYNLAELVDSSVQGDDYNLTFDVMKEAADQIGMKSDWVDSLKADNVSDRISKENLEAFEVDPNKVDAYTTVMNATVPWIKEATTGVLGVTSESITKEIAPLLKDIQRNGTLSDSKLNEWLTNHPTSQGENLEQIASREKEYKGEQTTFGLSDLMISPQMFESLQNAELVSDLESYGLTRDKIKDGKYITWEVSSDNAKLEQKYKDNFDKKPVGPEYERWKKLTTALDARKNWSKNVLPTLKVGTILYNEPQGGAGEARDKIYQHMGFGRTDGDGKQYAVVVKENGKKVVKPLRLSDKQKKKGQSKDMVEEAFTRLIKYNMKRAI